jgi:hypothetical protein
VIWVLLGSLALAAEGTTVGVGMSSAGYRTSNRALAGTGGTVRLEHVGNGHYVRGDLSVLVGVGPTVAPCASAGWIRDAHWSPSVGPELCVLLGRQVSFPTVEHPLPLVGPAPSIGLNVQPLRFSYERANVSALSLGVGLGWEPGSLAVAARVEFFTLAVPSRPFRASP